MDAEPRLWEPACNERRVRLIEAIHAAFPKWPPANEGLFATDDPYTYRLIEMHLLGKPWHELDLREWFDFGKPGRSVTSDSLDSDATYMLTPAGWAYYIPAYMLMCLTAVDPDVHLNDVIAHMGREMSHVDFDQFLSRLTPDQVEVCMDFLRFVAECHIFGGYERAAQVLSYWPGSNDPQPG